MTIPVEQTRYVYIGPYSVGDLLPVPFSYDEPEHVKMLRGNTLLEINVDYSVLGKNITVQTPIASDEKIVVFRDTPMDNDADFHQEAKFPSEKINDAIDKLTMQNQEQEDGILRAVKFPMGADTDLLNETTFPLPDPGKGIKWDNNGRLSNTNEDIDDLISKATEQANRAEANANIAEEQANIATSAANEAQNIILAGTAQITNQTAESLQTIIVATTNATNEAVDTIEEAGTDIIATAQSWATGTVEERPEGSAKYWADVAKETAQFDTYTSTEIDGKLAQKADNFVLGSGLSQDTSVSPRTLNVNETWLDARYPSLSSLDTKLSGKQDKLIQGSGITISEDNVISATGGGGSVSGDFVTLNTDQTITGKKKISNDGQMDMLSFEYTGSYYKPVAYVGMGSNNSGGILKLGVDYNSYSGGNEVHIGSNISSGAELSKKGIRFSPNSSGLENCHLVMGAINYASSIAFNNVTSHVIIKPYGGSQLDIGPDALIYTSNTGTSVDLLEKGATVPVATTTTAGKVKPDGTTIAVTADGTISSQYATYTEEEWNELTEVQKSNIKLALIYE